MDDKMSHAQVKREVIEDLIKVFEASGVEYTCRAANEYFKRNFK